MITGVPLGSKVYNFMNWNRGYCYKLCGSLARLEDENEIVLCFELDLKDSVFLTEKQRQDLGITLEDLGDQKDACLAEDKRRKEEEEQRKADIAAGRKPRKRKDTTIRSNNYSGIFGQKYTDHKDRIVLPPLEGKSANG